MGAAKAFFAFAVTGGIATSVIAAESESDVGIDLHWKHAGAPVQSFQQIGRVTRRTPLGYAAIAVCAAMERGYLLELSAPCTDFDLVSRSELSSHKGTVIAGNDSVAALTGDMPSSVSCRVHGIRPIDGRLVRREKWRNAAALRRL